MWEVIATVAIFGAGQIGLLIYLLGGMRATQTAHGERLDRHRARIEKLEDGQLKIVRDVAELQGEARS